MHVEHQSYNQEEIEAITSKYDTPYLMSIVAISIRPTNPLTRLFSRKSKSFLFVSIYDTVDKKKAFIKLDLSRNILTDVFLKSELFDAFGQLSKTN